MNQHHRTAYLTQWPMHPICPEKTSVGRRVFGSNSSGLRLEVFGSKVSIDGNCFGHQITYTKCGAFRFDYPNYSFEKTILPSFHFGVVLKPAAWNELHDRLEREEFLHTPATEFLVGRVGAHRSFFVKDPNGNRIAISN